MRIHSRAFLKADPTPPGGEVGIQPSQGLGACQENFGLSQPRPYRGEGSASSLFPAGRLAIPGLLRKALIHTQPGPEVPDRAKNTLGRIRFLLSSVFI